MALEYYFKDNGTYPIQLDELVPKYIVKIENPTVGNFTWIYENYKQTTEIENGYTLMVHGKYKDSSPVMWRDTLEWYVDTR